MPDLDPVWEVSVETVKSMLDAGEEFLLLDVRKPEEYAIACIPGARLIPLADLPTAFTDLAVDADLPIVTLCHKGMRGLQAAALLRQQGFEDVRSMAGGIDAWSEHVDPSVPRY